MNDLESQIITAAIQFIAQVAQQIMSSATASAAQKEALLTALKAAVDAEVIKVQSAKV